MKKLIQEISMFAVVISMASNTFATVPTRTIAQANEQSSQQKPLIAMTPGGTTPKGQKFESTTPPTYERETTLVERFLKYLGLETPSRTERATKPFSEVVLDHANLNDKPIVVPQVPQQPRNSSGKRRQGDNKYSAQIPQQGGSPNANIPTHRLSSEELLNLIKPEAQTSSNSNTTEGVQLRQLAELIAQIDHRAAQTRNGFYYPTDDSKVILKVTAEEAKRYSEMFPEMIFEASKAKNGYVDLKLKSREQKEALLLRYKVQPEVLNKFSPLMVNKTITHTLGEAGSHAVVSFPVEALTFYIGIYVNTLINLSIRYRNDPAALEKFLHETTSPAGQLSFLAFMVGNRMFTNLVSPHVSNKVLAKVLPFFGMGIGSMASAISHDVISMTKNCAIDLINVDEFDDKAQAKALSECQKTYDQVTSSSNMHNHIASFMNIIVAGAGAGASSQLITVASVLGAKGTKSAVQNAALSTGNRALISAGNILEGIAIEFNTVSQEMKAYSIANKNILKNGRMTMSARIAKWFGYIPGKEGNLTRVAFNVGRVGWKIGVGIVIFLQWDEWVRPYSFRFEQKLMGSGAELGMNRSRYNIQLDHLKNNNWSESICETHAAIKAKTRYKTFYTENPQDCDPHERLTTIKEQSTLWKDALLYKFMGSYSNWISYVDIYQAEWTITQKFYNLLAQYIYTAKANNFDPKKSTSFNPLLHDDGLYGVKFSERVNFEKATLTDDFGELTYDGMNKLRAQRVIDLLPKIGLKLREIRSEKFEHKDWKGVDETLVKIAQNITDYLVQSESQKLKDKGSILSFLRGQQNLNRREALKKLAKDHFSKKKLEDVDLPANNNYSQLVDTIDLINSNYENFTKAYRHTKKATSSRDRSSFEAERLLSLYKKAILFKEIRGFLGTPVPAARGEALVLAFDEEIKNSYPQETLKKLLGKSTSPASVLIEKAVCGNYFIKNALIQTDDMRNSIIDESWGKNAHFVIPRLVQHKPEAFCNNKAKVLYPTRSSESKSTALDYLMKNVSPAVATETGVDFSETWATFIDPRLEEVYENFSQSYHELLLKDFVPAFAGKDSMNYITKQPLDAYKYIKAQKSTRIANVSTHVIQNYVQEMDDYLRIIEDSFDLSLRTDAAIKNASNATPRQKELHLNALKNRQQRFKTVINHFRTSFMKVLLSFTNAKMDSAVPVATGESTRKDPYDLSVIRDYASMLYSYFTLLKNVGLVDGMKIEQESNYVEALGEDVTVVTASLSRNPVAEGMLLDYTALKMNKQIDNFIKEVGANEDVPKALLAAQALQEITASHFGQSMIRRIESDPSVRHHFEDIKSLLESENLTNHPYGKDRNMSLPVKSETGKVYQPPATLRYAHTGQLNSQFLGIAGAARGLDLLMEELFFNINILMAADLDSAYRNIERSQLDKFKSRTMGGGR